MRRHQQQAKALGSQSLFTVVTYDGIDATTIFDSLWAICAEFETRFSRFQAASELTHFNSQAGAKVPVSAEFVEVLEVCRAMSRKTEGLFNPFILPALNRAGYVGSWPEPTSFSEELNYEKRAKIVSIDRLELGTNWAEIPADTALDFGGIGKGFLLDKLGDHLQSRGVKNFWLSLGGDILCSGHDVDLREWSVAIQHATDETESVGIIPNSGGKVLGIATSGVTKRKGIRNEKAWHHIIDPRTGESAMTDIVTATVSAASSTEADVLAKCVVIAGSTEAKKFLDKHRIDVLYLQLSSGQTQVFKSQPGLPL